MCQDRTPRLAFSCPHPKTGLSQRPTVGSGLDQERRPTERQVDRSSCGRRDLSSRDRPLRDPRGKSRNGLPRHGAQPSRPSCHSLPWKGRLAVQLMLATMMRGLSCKPAVRSLMPILTEMIPLTAGMRLGSRIWHHPQAAPGCPPARQEGSLRSRYEGRLRQVSLSLYANLSLPFHVAPPSECPRHTAPFL